MNIGLISMVSLKRIAAELDVSYSLVSKVLNGRLGTTGVSAKTQDAIRRKARQLNYVPNRLAVALKAGRKGAIGVFFHHQGTPGSDLNGRLLKGLVEELDKIAIRMWLRFFSTDEEFAEACDSRLKSEIDGLLVAGVYHPGLWKKLRELEESGLPVLTLFDDVPEGSSGERVTSVRVCYETHGYLPTRHLLELGHRRLACVATVESRTAGFERAHREAGVPIDRRLIIPTKGFLMEDGRFAVEKLCKLGQMPEGIVCQSDAQANGAINELIIRGLKVPGDVKVTGVDNSPLAEDSIVPITSMTSEMRRAGHRAVKLLMQKIEGKKVDSVVYQPKLVGRTSTGMPGLRGVDRSLLE